MNHYPRHVGDFIRDTVGLTMLEDGAYNRLLDQYYAREGPLPADKAIIYRMARAISKQERAAVDSVLRQFFTFTPDGWRQMRADLELQAQCERSASARESAKPRWQKEHGKPDANAMRTHMRTHSEGNADAMLASSQKPEASKSRASRASALPPLEAPTVEHQRIAAEVGVSCQAEFAKYRDWLAANGKRQKNEEAGFRNWLRRAAEFKPKTSRTDLRQTVV